MNLLWHDDPQAFLSACSNSTEATWIFQHLPKTAGTSFIEEVFRHLPANSKSYNVYVTDDILKHEELGPTEQFDMAFERFNAHQGKQKHFFITGHFRRKHVEILRNVENARLLTMLREPFRRLVSDYRYSRTPKHPYHETFARNYPSFEVFMKDPGYQNRMATLIAGRDATFQECKGILQKEYQFCGVVERYRESLEIMAKMMGLAISSPSRFSNKTPEAAPDEIAELESHRDMAIELNQLDAEIYDEVSGRFERLWHKLRS